MDGARHAGVCDVVALPREAAVDEAAVDAFRVHNLGGPLLGAQTVHQELHPRGCGDARFEQVPQHVFLF